MLNLVIPGQAVWAFCTSRWLQKIQKSWALPSAHLGWGYVWPLETCSPTCVTLLNFVVLRHLTLSTL